MEIEKIEKLLNSQFFSHIFIILFNAIATIELSNTTGKSESKFSQVS
jgi:hypothetical protein